MILSDFRNFLKKYNVLALAIAFIMGGAINTFIQSFVNDLLMPLIGILIPNGTWQESAFVFFGASLKWGSFLSNSLNFVIIALVIYGFTKIVAHDEKKK